jgi:hypothetical protein
MTERLADPRTEEFIRRVHGVTLQKPFPLAGLLTAIAIAWKKTPGASGKRPLAPVA